MLIGEVSERSGITTRMLRHYDSIGLVSPSGRSPSGYRQYSDDDLRRLFYVEGLRSLGLGLREVAEALTDLSFHPKRMVEQLIAGTRERLRRDQELLERLNRVRASDPAAWSDVLHTIGLMRGLDLADASARQRFALSLTEEEGNAALLAEAVLSESEPNTAGALLWALARTGDAAVVVLARALDSEDAGRRHRAVAALTKIGSPAASAALAEAFAHADPFVSARATLARGLLGDSGVIDALVALIVDGRDDVDTADVLGELASDHGHADEATNAIANALSTAEPASRLRLTTALADIPGPEATATLRSLLEDDDRKVALTASAVLHHRDGKA